MMKMGRKMMKKFGLLRVMAFSFALALAVFSTPVAVIARDAPPSFADLAEKLLPSVVNISTSQTVTVRDDLQDFPDLQLPPGSPLDDFLHDFMQKKYGGKNGAKPLKRKSTALGSGFIIDPAGYVVTNYHVIQDADEITVILQDDTNVQATVVGRDKNTDLALLKIKTDKKLQAVPWGDSDKIRVGDWILAIGNPYGLGGTVTTGIISARARDIQSGPYDDYLQTDAPINRGNSGGPMFNMDGEVIGINTAIFSPSGGSIGIGFAIPTSLAKGVIEQIRNSGYVKRGWLGVRIQAVTPDIAEGFGLDSARGALVSSVTPESPAAKAKIESGDVITTFNNKPIKEMHNLPRVVAETPADTTVPVTLFRKGKEMTLDVKVGELKAKDEPDEAEENTDNTEKTPKDESQSVKSLGLKVAKLTDKFRETYSIPKESNGLVVTSVDSDGLAGQNGIVIGDVVLEANQKVAKSAKDLDEQAAAAKKAAKPLLVLVERKGESRFVAINFAKEEKSDKSDKSDKTK